MVRAHGLDAVQLELAFLAKRDREGRTTENRGGYLRRALCGGYHRGQAMPALPKPRPPVAVKPPPTREEREMIEERNRRDEEERRAEIERGRAKLPPAVRAELEARERRRAGRGEPAQARAEAEKRPPKPVAEFSVIGRIGMSSRAAARRMPAAEEGS